MHVPRPLALSLLHVPIWDVPQWGRGAERGPLRLLAHRPVQRSLLVLLPHKPSPIVLLRIFS